MDVVLPILCWRPDEAGLSPVRVGQSVAALFLASAVWLLVFGVCRRRRGRHGRPRDRVGSVAVTGVWMVAAATDVWVVAAVSQNAPLRVKAAGCPMGSAAYWPLSIWLADAPGSKVD